MPKTSSENVSNKRFHTPWVALAIAFIFLLVLIGHQVAEKLSGKVQIPNTVGLTLAEGSAQLTELGLIVADSTLFSEARDEWRIVRQKPASGKAMPGDTVLVVVSPPLVDTPNVLGLTEEEARSLLQESGFHVVESVSTYNDDVPAGTVVDMQNQGGEAFSDADVRLLVSKGPRPMPDLKGVEAADAKNILNRLGVRVLEVIPVKDSSQQNNVVIRTDPGPEVTIEEARNTGVRIYLNSLKR